MFSKDKDAITYTYNMLFICSVCKLLKCILAIQKQLTNQPQVITHQTDHSLGEHLEHLKYLNINDSFHLKDLEISKYKRESKTRMPIKFCRLILLIVVYLAF